MAAGVDDPGEHRLVVVPDDWLEVRGYVAGLPSADGTFTGYYDLTDDETEKLFGPPPPLIPVELDTCDQPNPAADLPDGAILSFTIAERRWQFTVHHSVHLAGNRWELWCYRDSIREVAVSDA